jgi:SAM-dependent methyltransferase
MSEPVYVKRVRKRESDFPWRYVGFSIFEPKPKDFTEELKWEEKYRWAFTFAVHRKDKEEAKELAIQLHNAKINPLPELDHPVINRLKEIRVKTDDEQIPVEKWGNAAIQMPEDWGPQGEDRKSQLKQVLTSVANGRVLEAMCGFNSYIGTSDKITEVVALDFCREALERYSNPERKRILYDLERVVKGEKIDFFEDASFRTISVCFAIDYLTDPVQVYKEFYRILSKGGQLLIVGGTTQGYVNLLKKYFDPKNCANTVKTAGFSVKTKHLPLETKFELGKYYLVKGLKK